MHAARRTITGGKRGGRVIPKNANRRHRAPSSKGEFNQACVLARACVPCFRRTVPARPDIFAAVPDGNPASPSRFIPCLHAVAWYTQEVGVAVEDGCVSVGAGSSDLHRTDIICQGGNGFRLDDRPSTGTVNPSLILTEVCRSAQPRMGTTECTTA